MTTLPPEIAGNLDGHRTALAIIRAMLTDNIQDALDLWFNQCDEERTDTAFALATQTGAYLTASYGGDEHGKQAAVAYAERALLVMAREGAPTGSS